MTVLVLTDEFDPTADRVVDILNQRDIPVFRCDTADFPQRVQLSAELRRNTDGWTGALRSEHRTVSLNEVRSVWYRRPTHFTFPDGLSEPERRRAEAEARLGFGGVLASLPVLWMNHPGREADTAYKPAQLAAATKCGLVIPRTLITNDPHAVTRFRANVGGPLVTKMLGAAAFVEESTPKIIYTTTLSDTDLTDLRGVSTTAHLFQEEITKVFECRVTVVGEECFTAAIHAHSPAARMDWRRHYDALEYSRIEAPTRVREGILAFMRHFGITFGAFDFAVDPAGEWHFLECNPCGHFGWIEAATGIPISEAIATLLAKGGPAA